MGSVYLTWLADALEGAGVNVVRYEGWTTRSRSTGGYEPGRPWCVMWHHTASPPSSPPQNDAYYMCYTSENRPVCNVMVDRTGTVWCLAAGASNTNGKGYALHFSKGTVPNDSMNTYAVGMEICNNGVGEPYPQVQIDAAFKVSNVVAERCGLSPTDVATHNLWAPDRKIDPATAAAVQGPWHPGSCTSSGTWDVDDLRAECVRRAGSKPPEPQPQPPVEDDEMKAYLTRASNQDIYLVAADMSLKTKLSQHEHDTLKATGQYLVCAFDQDLLNRIKVTQ